MCSPVSNRASLRIEIKSGNHGIGSILNARLSSRIGYRTLFVAANRRLLCIDSPNLIGHLPFSTRPSFGGYRNIAKYPASVSVSRLGERVIIRVTSAVDEGNPKLLEEERRDRAGFQTFQTGGKRVIEDTISSSRSDLIFATPA